MTYAAGRTFYDADSHLMELADWLARVRRSGRAREDPSALSGRRRRARRAGGGRRGGAARRSRGGARARGRRDGAEGLGGARRLRSGGAQPRARPARLRAAARVQHLRRRRSSSATTSSCSTAARAPTTAPWPSSARRDRRLIARRHGALGRSGARRSPRPRRRSGSAAARSWCRRHPGKGRSPTHPDYDGLLGPPPGERTSRSCCTSAAAGGRCRAPSTRTATPMTDFLGGGENIRSKDYMALHHPPEMFLSCMVLDGMFEKFPRLRGGCIEQGALWVVPWLQAPRHRAGDVPEDGARAAAAAARVRVRAPPGEVHAVPDGAGGLADRAGGRGAVPVLVGLPAPRGRPRSARALRGVARRRLRRRAGALLLAATSPR